MNQIRRNGNGSVTVQLPGGESELAEIVLEQADVAVVPGEAFGTPGYFRLSCALGDADLEEGLTRLAVLLAQAS